MANRNVEALTSPLKLGSGSNHLEIAVNGTPRLRGISTVYRDMVGDLFGRRLNSTAGKVDYDYANNAIKFQSGGNINAANDRVQANLQIDHIFKVGSISLYPHIHWFQPAPGNVLDWTSHVLTLRYRLIRNGYGVNLASPDWTTINVTPTSSNSRFDNSNLAGEGYCAQLTSLPNILIPACGISDTIQFQMTKSDSTGDNMLVYFMDMHGEVDSQGSDEPFLKEL